MIVKAYAKVNLILNVVGKRDDGYHELETIMQYIPDLYDVINIEKDDNKGMDDFKDLPFKEHDLMAKAILLMKKEFNKDDFYKISIEKHIPVAAGLGGGSADGAAVIYALCKMWDIEINEDIYLLSSKLGADVPFCLAAICGNKACLCRGIGEKLTPVPYTDVKIDILPTNIQIENKTKRIYEEFDKDIPTKKYDIDAFLNAKNIEDKVKLMGNQLQPSLERITGEKRNEILCGAGPSYFSIRLK